MACPAPSFGPGYALGVVSKKVKIMFNALRVNITYKQRKPDVAAKSISCKNESALLRTLPNIKAYA